MKNWTIKTLLTFGFSVPLAALIALIACFLVNLKQIDKQVDSITQDNIPGLELSNRALAEAYAYRVLTLTHLISTDPAEMAALEAKCDSLANTVSTTLRGHQETIRSAEEQALFEKIGPALDTYRTAAQRVRTASTAGDGCSSQTDGRGGSGIRGLRGRNS